MLLQQQPPAAGQDLPGDAATATSAASASTPTGATSADQFATDTLSSLLSAQEAPPSSADLASQVMSAVDSNGDGSLSLSEIETALGADTSTGAEASPIASAISQAFSQIDTNGDGEISSSELTSALDAQNQAQGAQQQQGPQGAHHHHHHAHAGGGAPPNGDDLASQLLGSADTDGDGTLSLSEIEGALGLSPTSSTSATSSTTAASSTASPDAASGAAATAAAAASSTTSSSALAALTTAFGQLDTNGDGKLSASELSAGIDAFMAAHARGATDAASQSVTA